MKAFMNLSNLFESYGRRYDVDFRILNHQPLKKLHRVDSFHFEQDYLGLELVCIYFISYSSTPLESKVSANTCQ